MANFWTPFVSDRAKTSDVTEVPRQERFVILGSLCQRQRLEQRRQIAIRIDAIGLAGLDQRVKVGAGVG